MLKGRHWMRLDRKRSAENSSVYGLLNTTILKAGLCFSGAILNGFHMIPTAQRIPRIDPPAFDDHIRIYQHGPAVTCHDALRVTDFVDTMLLEPTRHVIDTDVQQHSRAPQRNSTLVETLGNYLGKCFGK